MAAPAANTKISKRPVFKSGAQFTFNTRRTGSVFVFVFVALLPHKLPYHQKLFNFGKYQDSYGKYVFFN